MAFELQEELDTLDGVDDGLTKFYTETDGKFKLDLDNLQNTSKVNAILEKERGFTSEAERKLKDIEAKYKDVDLEAVEELRKKAEALEAERTKAEEQKLLDAHDFEQVLSNRIEKRDADWQSKLDTEISNTSKEQEINKALKRRALEGELNMQLLGVKGMHDGGKRDALKAAMDVYTLNDKGHAVMLDSNGDIVIGKDGKTPFSLREQADSQDYREDNTHWFLATGGGSGMIQGRSGAVGGTKTVKRDIFLNMSPPAQAKSRKDGFTVID